MSQILLIGYGAVAQYLFSALKTSTHSRINTVLCRPGREAFAQQALGTKVSCLSDLSLLDTPVDLAVECAGHQAMSTHVPALLRQGIDVIGVSNGALSDAQLAIQLEQAAVEGGATLQLLAGCRGRHGHSQCGKHRRTCQRTLQRCKTTQRLEGVTGGKNESILTLSPEPVTHFTGTAREAARDYPKNANVAATVALAGVGLDKTQVELVADPALSINRHEIEATGAFGQFSFVVQGNALPGNPRSSALTAMSLVQAIERRNAHVLVG